MAKDPTSEWLARARVHGDSPENATRLGSWYRTPFGRRVIGPEPPYSVIER